MATKNEVNEVASETVKAKSHVGARDTAGRTKTPQLLQSTRIKKVKRTFHLAPEEVQLLNRLRSSREDKSTGSTPNLSDLVGESIRLLAKKEGVTLASE